MARGGKREGAGRKAKGITRKVSLTLPEDVWEMIDESGKTVAEFLLHLVKPVKKAILFSTENEDFRYATECIEKAKQMIDVKDHVFFNGGDKEGYFLLVADFELDDEQAAEIIKSLNANYTDDELDEIITTNKSFEVR
ncbi:hypothetical protein [Brevibacillus sp. MER 51]|uniref:hypothetical protein n=1 Tax=Brevibacillus sp. MER 51 TaxID=2939560 RepID=UPI00203B0475|nr:hypothetical protein [Brevibacillus sp. MER 51]MCM3141687.1 hypothetical protein [Brevibacillus sp. MER 51]